MVSDCSDTSFYFTGKISHRNNLFLQERKEGLLLNKLSFILIYNAHMHTLVSKIVSQSKRQEH